MNAGRREHGRGGAGPVYDPERDFSDVISECRIDRRLILKRLWMTGVTNHLNSNTPWQPPVATIP